ncbi:MAG: LacI family transcriptional regulator [Rhodothermaceae bacterium]|nr:LacI family transcriptional regulator [Rhodothermaceae bacterium]
MKRTTLKDLAKLLNLSPSTISRALADHPDISENTKRRVQDVAKGMNYIPNLRAKYLRTRHSNVIALILPEMNMFFMPSLMNGINKVVENKDYSLIVLQSDNSLWKEKQLIQYCLNLSVDGILLSVSKETKNLSHLSPLLDNEVPVVLLDRLIDNDSFSTVNIANQEAAFKATNYLIEKGHQRIVGVFADTELSISTERILGFREAHAGSGIALRKNQILAIDNIEKFDTLFMRTLGKVKDVTAFFIMSDELMVRTFRLLRQCGYTIPDDCSLIAISDGEAPGFLFPNITHLLHSGYDVGEKAAHILIGLIKDYSDTVIDAKVKTALIEGGSVQEI